ncbi:ribonuclease Y [Candidatus Parcubacteria bacterium]|nr:ribonuclease Y [Patescibacteria group bacterium]MBU4380598.1 ribonuclease Y [Patescibacteria group bacterium]MCG2689526.1 ribonuclease Y [Candidatus Parcubacteria bacterium]
MITKIRSFLDTLIGLVKPHQPKVEPSTPPKPIIEKVEVPVAPDIILQEAKSQARELVIDAKNEALEIKKQAEEEARHTKQEALIIEKRLEDQKSQLLQKESDLAKKEGDIAETKEKYTQKLSEIEEIKKKQVEKLERAASMTKKDAEKVILDYTESKLAREIGRKVKEAETTISEQAEEKAKEILVNAMQKGYADYIAEYTVSKVKLPDEEMKGRIIGKEGRNIKAFEDATGVNLDLDETPTEVRISCFDSVRREIARIALEKLILDGRIQPAKIEEVVARCREEIDRATYRAGEELCQKVGVYNLPKEIVALLGKFKYRYSYGQNMIEHTLEEVKIGVAIATELKADIYTTKLACLLHDLGKAVSEEEEGTHIDLGVKLLKKHGIPQRVIDAVAEHHGDRFSSLESAILHIADGISGARPGARFVDYDSYVARMKGLEDTAQSFAGVDKAYALSAGREVRVIVKPDEATDEETAKLAFDIAQKIEKEHTYPGTVKITVIRDYRAVGMAK